MYKWFENFIFQKEEKQIINNLYFLFKSALIVGTIIIFISISIMSIQFCLDIDMKISEVFGVFGDFIGGSLNPIFTFLTFMGLLITIMLQQTELKESRIEFTKSANALIEQSKSLQKQNFENTFFNLIDLYNGILANLEMSYYNSGQSQIYTARKVFTYIERCICISNQKMTQDAYGQPIEGPKKHYSLETFSNYAKDLRHYFRIIYQILKFIDNANITNDEKLFYSNIFRSQFSDAELLTLFFNCLSKYGKEKFKPLVEKYEFFEHLVINEKFLLCDLREYDSYAFGENKYIEDFIESMNHN